MKSLQLLIIALFFSMCCSIVLSSATTSTTIQPVEIHWVRGCLEPSSASEPKRAAGCKPEGGQMITIRGRNFGRNSATASLVLPRTISGKMKHSEWTFPCKETKHSDTLPTLLLFCKLPEIFSKPTTTTATTKPNQEGSGEDLKHLFEATVGSGGANSQQQQQQQQQATEPKDQIANIPLSVLIEKLLQDRGLISFHVAVTTKSGQTTILRNIVDIVATGDGSSFDNAAPQTTRTQQKALENLVRADWKTIGVGGLTKEVRQLIRRVLSTRASKHAVELMRELGLPHVKGVLMHGLPGCGKTLLAKKIAEQLGATHVKVVNGPSLVSKFVGESEKNLRELFSPAQLDWKRFGANAPLHVIILDEVDAIMKTRHTNEETSSGSTAIYDGLTTQMLAALDGLESVGNVLVFALTNRKNSIDGALLRPGRFEVQLHLHLPNVKARKEILEIHSQKLEKSKLLSMAVDFDEIAELTPSFSGADLAGVVRSAVSFSLQRMTERFTKIANSPVDSCSSSSSADSSTSPCSSSKSTKTTDIDNTKLEPEQVTMEDFLKAIEEIRATKGSTAVDVPHRILRRGLVPTAAHAPLLLRLQKLVDSFIQLPAAGSMYRILLHGAPESGLTSIASSVCAMSSSFDSVQILRAESLLSSASSSNNGGGQASADKIADQLQKSLQTAQEGNNACLVIDGADHLSAAGEFVKGGIAQSLSTNILKALRQVLQAGAVASSSSSNSDFLDSKTPSDDSSVEDATPLAKGKIMIVMTVQSLSFIRSLTGSSALFDSEEHISLLGPQDVARVLLSYGIFPPTNGWRKAERVATNILASDIPIKRLLRVVDMVRAKTITTTSTTSVSPSCRANPNSIKLGDESSTNDVMFYEKLVSKSAASLMKQGNKQMTELKICDPVQVEDEKILKQALKEAASAFHVDV